jgi:hypothetical protein
MTRVGAITGGMVQARRAARPGGFALPSAPPELAPAAISAPAAAGLLALQATPAEPNAERQHRRAAATLDELRGLQLDLLNGAADPARLARLTALAESLDPRADSSLREAIGAVALRARLEIARRRAGRASQP